MSPTKCWATKRGGRLLGALTRDVGPRRGNGVQPFRPSLDRSLALCQGKKGEVQGMSQSLVQ